MNEEELKRRTKQFGLLVIRIVDFRLLIVD